MIIVVYCPFFILMPSKFFFYFNFFCDISCYYTNFMNTMEAVASWIQNFLIKALAYFSSIFPKSILGLACLSVFLDLGAPHQRSLSDLKRIWYEVGDFCILQIIYQWFLIMY